MANDGNNSFTVTVYDKLGRKITIPEPRIIITKTLASVEAIPASHSIAISALDRIGGTEKLVYLVRKDEPLPKKGRVIFRAAQVLRANADESLNFNIWEGEIESPYTDNRFAGVYKISGYDLSPGEIITIGSEIVCGYEISDGGALSMSASVASLGTDFGKKNFYVYSEARLDLNDTGRIAGEGREIIGRIDGMSEKIDDSRLDAARAKAENAAGIDSVIVAGNEEVQEASNDLQEAKNILSRVRMDHLRDVNLMELDECTEYFTRNVSQYAAQSESASFNNLARTARRLASDPGFDRYINELLRKINTILYRQDWFVTGLFNDAIHKPGDFSDIQRFGELKSRGMKCIRDNDIDGLRRIVPELYGLMRRTQPDYKQLGVNIIAAR